MPDYIKTNKQQGAELDFFKQPGGWIRFKQTNSHEAGLDSNKEKARG